MLGSSQVKSHVEQGHVLDVKPRVIAEWNMNAVASPYIHGTYDHPTTFSTLSLSSIDSSPVPTLVNRGDSNAIFTDTECQLILIQQKSASASISHKQANNGIVTLTARKSVNISPGTGITVTGLGANYDGNFIALNGTNGTIIKYDTSNVSLNLDKKRVRPAGYVTANLSKYSVDYDVSSVPTKAAKFFVKLKSDYMHQSTVELNTNVLETVEVKISAVGYRNGLPVFTQVVTKNYSVNSVNWTNASLSFANPDEQENPIDLIKFILTVESSSSSDASLLVDELYATPISEYEVYIQDRLPLSEVFEIDRPGEILMDYGPINVVLNDQESFPQQPSPTHMASSYALGPYFEKVQRSITPFANNPYSYYVSGSDADSKKIWTLYDKEFNINRLVIKINAIAAKPSVDQFIIKVLTSQGWQKINTTGLEFSNNGILNLYYKSGSWSDTKWANHLIPRFDSDSLQFTDSTKIKGVYFEVVQQEYIAPDSLLNVDPAINVLELVEISPRLEIDLSEYVISLNIDKEMESSDVPLPFGSITANTAGVSFTSVPIIFNDSDTKSSENDDIIPVSNYSSTSPFKDLLVRGVKIKAHMDLDRENRLIGLSSDKDVIPMFVMYAERWLEEEEGVTVECYDSIKKMQSIPTRPLYLEGKSVNEIIYSILDSVGIFEYDSNELFDLDITRFEGKSYSDYFLQNKPVVEYYWASKELSISDSLNEIFKVYQISMHVDEYGVIRFSSLYDVNKRINNIINSEDDSSIVYVQDVNDSNSRSNLISASFEEIERPEKIILRYKRPSPSTSDYRQARRRVNTFFTTKATDIVWEPEQESQVLTFFELAAPGIVSETQDRIPFNVDKASTLQNSIENSGYLLIDQEIVKYDGIEYAFTISGDEEYSRVEAIRNTSDINRILSEIFQEKKTNRINWTPTGFMVNVQRGLFGTVAAEHPILAPNKRNGWKSREFNNNYKNTSSIEESDGFYGSSEGGISIKSNKSNGGFFIYPGENNTVDKKRRFFARYKLNSIPAGKTGWLGAAIGIDIQNGDIENGLFVWTGVKNKNKQTTITVKIEQITNGNKNSILAAKDFDFSEDLFSYDETMEMYLEFNNSMDNMKVYIGSTSLFQTVKEKKKKKTGKTVEFKTHTVKLKRKIKKNGLFGFGALENGQGLLDALAFTRRTNPRNLNDIKIFNMPNSYSYQSGDKTSPGYYIGANNLLDNIIYNQYISGFNIMKDSFVFTGSPVARGIKIFEVDYQDYPVTGGPQAEFLGYSYSIDAIRNAKIINGSENIT